MHSYLLTGRRACAGVAAFAFIALGTTAATADTPAAETRDQGKAGNGEMAPMWWASDPDQKVDSSGIYSDAISLEVPAFRKLTPKLALAYASSGENGWAGVGWRLDGVSRIERATPGRGTPRYDASDIYLLDGQELIPCVAGSPSPSCTTGGTHSTKTENYARIVLTGTGTTSQWTITDKDGTRSVFAPVFTVSGNVYRWGVSQDIDTKNNVVAYSWGTNLLGGVGDYLDSIAYNGTVIKLYYEARTDIETSAIGAGLLERVAARIKTIDVTVSGSRRRSYKLSYGASGATSRSLLASVQQFGKDATLDASGTVTGGTSVPAIPAGYPATSNPSFALASSDTAMGSYAQNPHFVSMDIDGDGKSDMLHVQTSACLFGICKYSATAWFSTGTGFRKGSDIALPSYEEHAQFIAMDIDGDGKDDFIALTKQPSKWKRSIFFSTGTGFKAGPTDTSMSYAEDGGVATSHFLPADIDGDGKTDLIEIGETCLLSVCSYKRVAWISSGAGFTQKSSAGGMTYNASTQFYAMDFNGDGKSDFIEINPGVLGVSQRRVWLSDGSGFSQLLNDKSSFVAGMRAIAMDVNGDGKTDLVELLPSGGVAIRKTWLSTGTSLVLGSSTTTLAINNDSRVIAGDLNGDGKGDFVVFSSSGVLGAQRAIFLSAGNDFTAGTTDWLGSQGEHQYLAGDVDGDGRADMVEIYSLAGTVGRRLSLTSGAFPDLLTSLGTGLGGTTTVSYTPSSAWTNANNPPIVQTATSMTVSDGRGGSATSTLSYSGGNYNVVQRRFLGFAYRKTTLPCITGESACPYNETWFRQDYGAATMPSRSDLRTGSGNLLRSELFEYQTNGATLPWTALASGRWVHMYVGTNSGAACPGADCKRRYRSRTFNAYGEVTQESEYGDYDVTGDERTLSTVYVPNTAAYIVNRPADVKTFQGVGTAGALLNESLSYYDGATTWNQAPSAGFVTKSAHWLSNPSSFVTLQKEYDSWGNVTAEIDALGARSTFVFDASYHLFPTSATNALTQTVTTNWDPLCGTPTTTINFNGQATTLTSDALCRLSQKTEPGGKFENHTWVGLGDATSQYEQIDEPSADGTTSARWSRRYFDGLQRTWREATKGPNATTGDIYVDTSFNARGEEASKTAPYYWASGNPTTYSTTFSYDALGRRTRVSYPDGAYSATSYGLWSATDTDELGRSKTDRFNAYGRRVAHDETVSGAIKSTTYVYDARQNLQQTIDPATNITTTLTTDSLGRVTTEVDVDRGTTIYEYDGKGRLTATTDAKNQRTTFDYDALDRKIDKTTNAGTAQASTVSWTYDEPQAGYFNVGALTSMTDGAGAKTFDYDVLGRLVHSVRTIDGTNYTFMHGFDAGGRALWTTYPDGDTLGTSASPLLYDSAGRLQSIPGYVTSAKYDAKGDVVQINNANGTVTTRAYSAQRGWIDSIATTFGTTSIQDLVYTHNAKGMVSAVTSPFANEAWSYVYDELDRLTTATNTWDDTQSQTFAYDAIGNITSNSRIGTYSYHATKKHAVTAAGGGTYAYDAAGLMTSGPNRTLTWDGDNLLASVTAGGTTMIFRYDANGERIDQLEGMTSHRYLGDDYEISDGSTKKYVALGGVPIARKDGTTKTWIHTDHLGTIQAETDASGVESHRRKFRPFGEMIAMGQPLDVEPRGYTGQRQDASGLVYLHARYYDPALGRFISGDDIIDGADTVGLNRYAYTGNDPVNRSDVTGRCITCVLDAEGDNGAPGGGSGAGPGFVVNSQFTGPGPADPTTVLDRLSVLSLFIPVPAAAVAKVGVLGRSLLPNLRLIASGGPTAARTTTAVAAGTESLIIPQSLGAAANITMQSRIGESPKAIRLAEAMSQSAQKDVDSLLAQVRAGNGNPGKGTRALGDGFFELRGENAGRVIIKQTDSTAYDIVGKFQGHVHGDTANSKTIKRLISDYNAHHP